MISKHKVISEDSKDKFNIEIQHLSLDYDVVPHTFQRSDSGVFTVMLRLSATGLHKRKLQLEQMRQPAD